jgi:hypothetical protein
VVVSHDFRATKLPPGTFDSDSNIHVIGGKGGRGDFEIIEGYLAALLWLRQHNVDYDWITNLSAQDYPVSSLAAMTRELASAQHDGFLHHFDAVRQQPQDMQPMAWPERHGYERYYYQYTKLKDSLGVVERAALRIPRRIVEGLTDRVKFNTAYGLMVGWRAARPPFSPAFRCYAGSYWHTIRRRCAEYLLEFFETQPEIIAYLRRVLIPDECFVQTVLANHPAFHFVNDNRRYFDMRGSRLGHPKLMTEDDLPNFVDRRYFFARKFAHTPALLDRLDRSVLDDDERPDAPSTAATGARRLTLPAAPSS